jgi:hypothetical protein
MTPLEIKVEILNESLAAHLVGFETLIGLIRELALVVKDQETAINELSSRLSMIDGVYK